MAVCPTCGDPVAPGTRGRCPLCRSMGEPASPKPRPVKRKVPPNRPWSTP